MISGARAVTHTVAPPLFAFTAQWMTLPTSSAVGVYRVPWPTTSESVQVRFWVPNSDSAGVATFPRSSWLGARNRGCSGPIGFERYQVTQKSAPGVFSHSPRPQVSG